jgi:enamine deaminase RidA (YjgF/YER057c/UK114 family)
MKLLVSTLAAAGVLMLAGAASAQNVHAGDPKSAIASSVTVPAGSDTIYVSGMVPPVIDETAPAGSTARYGDTKTQSLAVFKKLEDALKAQGYGFGDVVMMRVYLVGDPAKGGVMDFAGMMEAYKTFFGTEAQPNKPARVTMQVAALVGPGMLAEIEVQAAKKAR